MTDLFPALLFAAVSAVSATTTVTATAEKFLWLRFAHGRSEQTFAHTISCKSPTTFKFSIAPGKPLTTTATVVARDYRDDRMIVTTSYAAESVERGVSGVAPAGAHALTVTPQCGTSGKMGRVRVWVSLRIRSVEVAGK